MENKFDRYRVFVNATQGRFLVASSHTVNDLVDQIKVWMKSGEGRYVTDDEVQSVEMYELDPNGGVVDTQKVAINNIKDLLKASDEMGAR